MLFNSLEYLWFFPTIFIVYWVLGSYGSLQLQNIFLLIASYFFYGTWSIFFLTILLFSTLLDYTLAFKVNHPSKKTAKFFLTLSVLSNIGILAVFKYYNFFIHELTETLSNIGIHTSLPLLELLVPIGISFYTFHGLSYVFDIYRDKQKPIKNIVDYALFVSFFPLLVAGPIERANHLVPQIQQKRNFTFKQAREGCYLLLYGFFKKIVIADSLAHIVNSTFETHQNYTAMSLMLAAIAFSFQIYCDFSGYSDIAMGSAKLLGFEILSNFKFPYFAKNIREFWQRWHISLTSWFRDYLYIPLGGSKGSKLKTIRNILLVFIVSGIWHGANWTFLYWGSIHAFIYILYVIFPKGRIQEKSASALKKSLQILTTFGIVTIAWIFFRVKTLSAAFSYCKSIIANLYDCPEKFFTGEGLTNTQVIPYILAVLLIDWKIKKDERNIGVPIFKKITFLILLLIVYKVLTNKEAEFIYFQF